MKTLVYILAVFIFVGIATKPKNKKIVHKTYDTILKVVTTDSVKDSTNIRLDEKIDSVNLNIKYLKYEFKQANK